MIPIIVQSEYKSLKKGLRNDYIVLLVFFLSFFNNAYVPNSLNSDVLMANLFCFVTPILAPLNKISCSVCVLL